MQLAKILIVAVMLPIAIPSLGFATDRFYRDIVVNSPSGRYRVEAKSPDNAGTGGRRAFQANFVYTCRDLTTNTVLWTREQAMEEPQPILEGSTSLYQGWIEPSPIALFVSDDGWTVIYVSGYYFIVVDKQGKDRGRVSLLKEGFTAAERNRYVVYTTAGEMWRGPNDYFFRNVGKQQFFVMRPPWGRSVIIDLETGQLNEKRASSAAMLWTIGILAALIVVPQLLLVPFLILRQRAPKQSQIVA